MEAYQISRIGEQVRYQREILRCSRTNLASLLQLDIELIVAIENGFGNLSDAKNLLERMKSVTEMA